MRAETKQGDPTEALPRLSERQRSRAVWSEEEAGVTGHAMAESVHLFLKINGSDVRGESTLQTLGRDGSIECLSFHQSVSVAREAGTGLPVGRRQHGPIVILKRMDSSSPTLMRALVENRVVEGVFKFYRPHPGGDGTTEHFYSIEIRRARVSSIELSSPSALQPATSHEPPLETVAFTFHTVAWTYVNGGISHEDTWNANR